MFNKKHVVIKKAKLADATSIHHIETLAFSYNKLQLSSIKYHIKNSKASLLTAQYKGKVIGYSLVFLPLFAKYARLYSIAIHPDYRGKGISATLLQSLEEHAVDRGKILIRLEVKPDNKAAIHLYESHFYRRFKVIKNYYEDHSPALQYEKRILPSKNQLKRNIPYYSQKTDFTCGPASLLMLMSALDKKVKMDITEELSIWREATTIFMTAGHGGCGPRGLAIAAFNRGYRSAIILNKTEPLFMEGLRTKKKKEIIKVVHSNFVDTIKKLKIPVVYKDWVWKDIDTKIKNGYLALILISSYKITKTKAPHWVALSGIDSNHIYLHDPDLHKGKSIIDNCHIPVEKKEFSKMAKFGKSQLQAVVFIKKRG